MPRRGQLLPELAGRQRRGVRWGRRGQRLPGPARVEILFLQRYNGSGNIKGASSKRCIKHYEREGERERETAHETHLCGVKRKIRA